MPELSQRLEAVEAEIAKLTDENKSLTAKIEANNAEIAKAMRVAESYRTIISYESGGLDLSVADDERQSSQEPEKVSWTTESPLMDEMASRIKSVERKPTDMLKPEYKGVTQSEVALSVLQTDPTHRFSTDEIVASVYDTQDDDEFKRARNTMGATLSRGLVKGLWKGSKGFYWLEDMSNELFN